MNIVIATLLMVANEPLADCPPLGSATRDRLLAAGERCADDPDGLAATDIRKGNPVGHGAAERARARAHVQRGVNFKDRPLPAATQSQIRRLMDREYLYDGLSARYEFPAWKHPDIYCFRVNAKNRMGAYAGWSEISVALGPGGVVKDVVDEECP